MIIDTTGYWVEPHLVDALKPKYSLFLCDAKRRLDAETYRIIKVNQRTVDTLLRALTLLRPKSVKVTQCPRTFVSSVTR